MIYIPLTNGLIAGTGTVELNGYLFGGAIINGDGTNAATILIRETDSAGSILYHAITKNPQQIIMPIKSEVKTLYYSITGTGGSAQLFEVME